MEVDDVYFRQEQLNEEYPREKLGSEEKREGPYTGFGDLRLLKVCRRKKIKSVETKVEGDFSEDCLRKVPVGLCDDSFKKMEWFLSFDEKERYFSKILTEANLRSSSLWSHVPADHRMSKPPKSLPPLLGPEGAMARFHSRKRNVAGSSGVSEEEAAALIHPPSPAQARKKETRLALTNPSHADHLDDQLNLPFPNVLAHSHFESVRGVAEQLLLPADREVLKEMGDRDVATALFEQTFLGMQKAAFLKERILAMAAELEALKVEKANWRKDMMTVKKAHDDADRIIKKLELDRLEDARRAAADYQVLQERVRQLEEQVVDVSCDTEITSRGLMVEEFLRIRPPQTWDVTRYLAEFEEWKSENPGWVPPM